MKRSSGFKVSVPLVIDVLEEYQIPIYFCCGLEAVNLQIKPSTVFEVLPEDYNQTINGLINLLPNSRKNKPDWFVQIQGNSTDYNNEYVLAGFCLALISEGYLSESIPEAIEILNSLDIPDINLAIVKTALTGGVYLSHRNIHERLYGSLGLFMSKVNKTDAALNIKPINTINVLSFVVGLIKNSDFLLQSALSLPNKHRSDNILGSIVHPGGDYYYVFTRTNDDTWCVDSDIQWTAEVVPEGTYIL